MFVSIKHELTANARNTIVELNDVSYWIWTPTVEYVMRARGQRDYYT